MQQDQKIFLKLKKDLEEFRAKNPNQSKLGENTLAALGSLISGDFDKVAEIKFSSIRDELNGKDGEGEAWEQSTEGILDLIDVDSEFYKATPQWIASYEELNLLNTIYSRLKKTVKSDEVKGTIRIETTTEETKDVKPEEIRRVLLSCANARMDNLATQIAIEEFFFLPEVFDLLKTLGLITNQKANKENFRDALSPKNLDYLKKLQSKDIVPFLRGCQYLLATRQQIDDLSTIHSLSKKKRPIETNLKNRELIDNAWKHALCYALPQAQRDQFRFSEFDEQWHTQFTLKFETDSNVYTNDNQLYKEFRNHSQLKAEGLGREGGLGTAIRFNNVEFKPQVGKPTSPEDCFLVILEFINKMDLEFVQEFGGKYNIIKWILDGISLQDYSELPIQNETEQFNLTPYKAVGGDSETLFRYENKKLTIEFRKNGKFFSKKQIEDTTIEKKDNFTGKTHSYFEENHYSMFTDAEMVRKGDRTQTVVRSTFLTGVTDDVFNKQQDPYQGSLQTVVSYLGYEKECQNQNLEDKKQTQPKENIDRDLYKRAIDLLSYFDENKSTFDRDYQVLEYLIGRNSPNIKEKLYQFREKFYNHYIAQDNLTEIQKETLDKLPIRINLEILRIVKTVEKLIEDTKSEYNIRPKIENLKFCGLQIITDYFAQCNPNINIIIFNKIQRRFEDKIDMLANPRIEEFNRLRLTQFGEQYFARQLREFETKYINPRNSASDAIIRCAIAMSDLQKKINCAEDEIKLAEAIKKLKFDVSEKISALWKKQFHTNKTNPDGYFKKTLENFQLMFYRFSEEISQYRFQINKIKVEVPKNIVDRLIKLENENAILISSFIQMKPENTVLISSSTEIKPDSICIDKFIQLWEKHQNFTRQINKIIADLHQNNENQLSMYITTLEHNHHSLFTSKTLTIAKKLLSSLTNLDPLPRVLQNEIQIIKSDPKLNDIVNDFHNTNQLPSNFKVYYPKIIFSSHSEENTQFFNL